MNRRWTTMGTVASLRAPEGALAAGLLAELESVFAEADARFSLYRADSELARIGRGELPLEEASGALRDAYACALEWRGRTDGAFTPHRPDGVIDLSGVVKALAMAEGADLLSREGATRWALGVGGDVVWEGPATGVMGIVDPADRGALLATLGPAPARRALATSGSAERGEHIWLRDDLPRSPFAQVSVLADDIVTADVLATAVVAGGEDALDRVCDGWDVDVLAVRHDGSLLATPGLRAALDRAVGGAVVNAER